MISIDNSVWNLLRDAPDLLTVKIFFFIATNQPEIGLHGFQTTKIQLQIDLKSSQTSIFRSIKWLKENMLVQEVKLVEKSDFMASPFFIVNNSDQTARIAEWNRRKRLDIQRERRLKHERRLRQLRNEKKQKN